MLSMADSRSGPLPGRPRCGQPTPSVAYAGKPGRGCRQRHRSRLGGLCHPFPDGYV